MIRNFGRIRPRVDGSAYIAPSAEIIGDVEIGKGSSVWHNATLRGDFGPVRVGRFVNVQDNCVLHSQKDSGDYPTIVGDRVSIGHGAIVHGCRVRGDAIIGMGAIVLNGAEIGEWSIVGAGAVVTENTKIPPKSIVVGVPARVLRKCTNEDLKRIEYNWKEYVEMMKKYRPRLKGSR